MYNFIFIYNFILFFALWVLAFFFSLSFPFSPTPRFAARPNGDTHFIRLSPQYADKEGAPPPVSLGYGGRDHRNPRTSPTATSARCASCHA